MKEGVVFLIYHLLRGFAKFFLLVLISCLEFGSGLIPYVVEGLETDYLNQCRKGMYFIL